MNFTEAILAARSVDGYLATITSLEEQEFIEISYPNMTFWIGAADDYGILFL